MKINLTSMSKHYVTGRGLIFAVDLSKNGVKHHDLKIGEQVQIDGNFYTLTGVEGSRQGDYVSPQVGLLVRGEEKACG